jgi:hypothetical protein
MIEHRAGYGVVVGFDQVGIQPVVFMFGMAVFMEIELAVAESEVIDNTFYTLHRGTRYNGRGPCCVRCQGASSNFPWC